VEGERIMTQTLKQRWKEHLGQILHITITGIDDFSETNIQLTCLIHELQEYVTFELYSKGEEYDE